MKKKEGNKEWNAIKHKAQIWMLQRARIGEDGEWNAYQDKFDNMFKKQSEMNMESNRE